MQMQRAGCWACGSTKRGIKAELRAVLASRNQHQGRTPNIWVSTRSAGAQSQILSQTPPPSPACPRATAARASPRGGRGRREGRRGERERGWGVRGGTAAGGQGGAGVSIAPHPLALRSPPGRSLALVGVEVGSSWKEAASTSSSSRSVRLYTSSRSMSSCLKSLVSTPGRGTRIPPRLGRASCCQWWRVTEPGNEGGTHTQNRGAQPSPGAPPRLHGGTKKPPPNPSPSSGFTICSLSGR